MQKKCVSFSSHHIRCTSLELGHALPSFHEVWYGHMRFEGNPNLVRVDGFSRNSIGHHIAEGTCCSLNSIQSVLTIRHANS